MVANVRPIVSDTCQCSCGNVKNDLVHYKKNLQHIDVVSGPSLHQTADPSLLFPSKIAAFLTGSGADESGRRLHAVESTEEI